MTVESLNQIACVHTVRMVFNSDITFGNGYMLQHVEAALDGRGMKQNVIAGTTIARHVKCDTDYRIAWNLTEPFAIGANFIVRPGLN
ncbi:MAG: hypothetical protein ACLPVO_18875 [Desulfomonilaceae bacterium]